MLVFDWESDTANEDPNRHPPSIAVKDLVCQISKSCLRGTMVDEKRCWRPLDNQEVKRLSGPRRSRGLLSPLTYCTPISGTAGYHGQRQADQQSGIIRESTGAQLAPPNRRLKRKAQ